MYDWMQPINGFYAQPNGTGGVNYFQIVDDGDTNRSIPTTKEMYASYTGMDVGQIEHQALNDFNMISQEQEIPARDTGETGETGTGEAEPTFETHYVNGVAYNDPISYANAVTEAVMAEWDKQNKMLTSAYQAGLLDFGQYQDMIRQSRDTVKKQYTDAMSSISGKYSALSPDAYQSSQGSSEMVAGDVTKQNYQNIDTEEANLGLRKSLYDEDYANKLEENRMASQNQIDQNLNQTSASISGTPYANQVNKLNAPKINTINPMNNSLLGSYDALSRMQKAGTPGIRQKIDETNADPNIKDWLYTKFGQTV